MNIRTGIIAATFIVLSGVTATSYAGDYQENLLYNPKPSTLLAEARGRVMIYDGLLNDVIDEVLDTQFDRIGNMMFIRTKYVDDSGETYEYDDCD